MIVRLLVKPRSYLKSCNNATYVLLCCQNTYSNDLWANLASHITSATVGGDVITTVFYKSPGTATLHMTGKVKWFLRCPSLKRYYSCFVKNMATLSSVIVIYVYYTGSTNLWRLQAGWLRIIFLVQTLCFASLALCFPHFWDRFSFESFGFPLPVLFRHCSMIIHSFIHPSITDAI